VQHADEGDADSVELDARCMKMREAPQSPPSPRGLLFLCRSLGIGRVSQCALSNAAVVVG